MQEVHWAYVIHSEDVLYVFWTFHGRSILVLVRQDHLSNFKLINFIEKTNFSVYTVFACNNLSHLLHFPIIKSKSPTRYVGALRRFRRKRHINCITREQERFVLSSSSTALVATWSSGALSEKIQRDQSHCITQ